MYETRRIRNMKIEAAERKDKQKAELVGSGRSCSPSFQDLIIGGWSVRSVSKLAWNVSWICCVDCHWSSTKHDEMEVYRYDIGLLYHTASLSIWIRHAKGSSGPTDKQLQMISDKYKTLLRILKAL